MPCSYVERTVATAMTWCHRTLSWRWIWIGRVYGWIWARSGWYCLVTAVVWMFQVVPNMSLLQDWAVGWCCVVTGTITQQFIHQERQITCCGAVLCQDVISWPSLWMVMRELFWPHVFQHLVHLHKRSSLVNSNQLNAINKKLKTYVLAQMWPLRKVFVALSHQNSFKNTI